MERVIKRIAHKYLSALLVDYDKSQLDVAILKGKIRLEQAGELRRLWKRIVTHC